MYFISGVQCALHVCTCAHIQYMYIAAFVLSAPFLLLPTDMRNIPQATKPSADIHVVLPHHIGQSTHTHTHTHAAMCLETRVCVCVCVCVALGIGVCCTINVEIVMVTVF